MSRKAREDASTEDDDYNSTILPPSGISRNASPSAKTQEEAEVDIGLADDQHAIRVGVRQSPPRVNTASLRPHSIE